MSDHVRIAPSLLGADPLRLAEAVGATQGSADAFHVDVMDFQFAENAFGSTAMVSRLRETTEVDIECHLMVRAPERLATGFAEAGASEVIIHAEAMTDADAMAALARDIRRAGARPGLAVGVETSQSFFWDALVEFDTLLLITVPRLGFGAQTVHAAAWSRLRQLRGRIDDAAIRMRVGVDGGIHAGNIREACAAGATAAVVGSAVFRAPSPTAELDELRTLAGLGARACRNDLPRTPTHL